MVTLGLLRGVQQTRAPMIFAAVSYWLVGLPVSYVLGCNFGLGGVGVWLGLVYGLSIAWITMSVPLGFFANQHRAQVVHCQKQLFCDRFQFIVFGLGIGPMRSQI